MKPPTSSILAGPISGAIVFAGIVAWSFLITGDWPPPALLAGASVGGMASPLLWGWIGKRRDDSLRRKRDGDDAR